MFFLLGTQALWFLKCFVTKVTFEWLLSIMSSRRKKEKSKFVFKCFFHYGLKLNDFLNLNYFFVTKVTIEWLLSFMSSRNKREKVNISSQNLQFLQKTVLETLSRIFFIKKIGKIPKITAQSYHPSNKNA